jgi:hypothetical protein
MSAYMQFVRVRYAGAFHKPHRFVVSQGIWDRLREERTMVNEWVPEVPNGTTILDWPVKLVAGLPDDYLGSEPIDTVRHPLDPEVVARAVGRRRYTLA